MTRIASSTVGSGPQRVVFIHGLLGRGKNFNAIARALADRCTSLLVDLPNHGESEWTEQFDYFEQVEILADFLRADFAADGPVVVVGHSMGGKVSMLLALRHPELVERLVVVDMAPKDTGAASDTIKGIITAMRGLDLKALTSRAQADELLAPEIESPAVRAFALQNLRRVDGGFEWQPNLELLFRSLATIRNWPDMSGVTYGGKVLWIAGGKSAYTSGDDARAMRALFPNERRFVIHEAGHWVYSEEPEIFIKGLSRFLER
nr:alpha/beta fold hydrolase [Pseudoclavibacter sp. Marseille-Q3772]